MREPEIKDRVVLVCGHGSPDEGRVIARRETRWGVDWQVLCADGRVEWINGYDGIATASAHDSFSGVSAIGVYLVA